MAVLCPLCGVNMDFFDIFAREVHADKCAENMFHEIDVLQSLALDVAPPDLKSPENIPEEEVRLKVPDISKAEFEDDTNESDFYGYDSHACTAPMSEIEPEASETLVKQDNNFPQVSVNASDKRISYSDSKLGRVESEEEISNTPANGTKRSASLSPGSTVAKAVAKRRKSTKAEASVSPNQKRPIPYFKTLQFATAKIAVDAFCYGAIDGVDAYFLTHYHSDHYGGLGKSWKAGQIYCTPSTARLVAQQLKVNPEFLVPVDLDVVSSVHGVSFVFLDANHCPGSAIILFENRILHTGDFRASIDVLETVKGYTGSLDSLYLDTTYLDPSRSFPSQISVVKACAAYCRRLQDKPPARSFFMAQRPTRILALVGTYTIGKERLAIEIAHHMGSKVWTNNRKRQILNLLEDPELDDLLDVENGLDCQVHLTSMSELSLLKLKDQWKFLKKHFTHLVAFIPTGWTYMAPKGSTGPAPEFSVDILAQKVIVDGFIHLCRVPYSEHSSFLELKEFCLAMQSKKIIPTVGGKNHHILQDWVSK